MYITKEVPVRQINFPNKVSHLFELVISNLEEGYVFSYNSCREFLGLLMFDTVGNNAVPLTIFYHQFGFLIGQYSVAEM